MAKSGLEHKLCDSSDQVLNYCVSPSYSEVCDKLTLEPCVCVCACVCVCMCIALLLISFCYVSLCLFGLSSLSSPIKLKEDFWEPGWVLVGVSGGSAW